VRVRVRRGICMLSLRGWRFSEEDSFISFVSLAADFGALRFCIFGCFVVSMG
jgi:hypothetical protein